MSERSRKKKPLNFRRVKNWVLSMLGLIVIFMAISFSLARVAIKLVPDYTTDIQEIISEQLGFKVEVGFLDAEISWLIPRLNLIDVNIFDSTGKQHILHLDEIDLSLDWYTTIKTQLPAVGEITVIGLNAQVGINKKSQLVFQDYVVDPDIDKTLESGSQIAQGESIKFSDNLKYYINNLNFKILDSQFRFFDNRDKQKSRVLNNFNLRLLNGGDEHKFEIQADLPENYGKNVHLILDINGDLFDYKNLNGEAYLSVDDFYAASWLDDFWSELGLAANANVNAKIWLGWNGQKITEVYSEFKLKDVATHYLDASVKTWNIESFNGQVWWRLTEQGWQLDVRNLESIREGNIWPKSSAINVVKLNSKDELHIQSDFLRIEGVTYLAGMAASIYDAKDPWLELLHKYRPTGDVEYLDVVLPVDQPEKVKLTAEFGRLSVTLPDMEPSKVINLGGAFNYEDEHARILIDAKNSQVEFARLFRDMMQLDEIYGVMDIFNQDDEWRVYSESIKVVSPHIETESRIAVTISETQPAFLDITTKFKNGNAKYTSLYLPVSIMNDDTVDWLDDAIKSGSVTQGGYQFYGYVTDLPFRNREGISLANFDVEDVNLHYLKNWPDIQSIDASLRFENDAMHIMAHSGKLFDSNFTQAEASINTFFSPVLDIKGNIATRLTDIRRFVDNSGLHSKTNSFIKNVEPSGDGSLDLELFIPLSKNAAVEWGGKLSVENAGLKLLNENYTFSELSGELRFANAFVESPLITARLGDKKLIAVVGTRDVEGEKSYHIDVEGNINSKLLASSVPTVQDYIDGYANWNFQIDIAGSKIFNNELVNIHLSSDLEEVVSTMPGPLRKTIDEQMSFSLKAKVFDDLTSSYELNLSDEKQFKLNNQEKYFHVVADTPGLKGELIKYKPDDSPKSMEVNLNYLNVNDLLEKNNGDINVQGDISDLVADPKDLPAIDFKANQVYWDDMVFSEVNLQTSKHKSGLLIDELKIVSTNYMLTAKGDWFVGWNKLHKTNIDAQLRIKNLGRALKEFDLSKDVKDADGKANVSLQWNDMPHKFNWENIEGKGSLKLEDGVFTKIDAGAGRMLGLFNLKTLFSLDYAKQVSKGFAFDEMKGNFTFDKGNAYTDNLVIESKAADVFIKGRLGIQDKTVDQVVRVRPHVGSTVAFGAAVMASPAVGGLVYLFQKVFNPDALSEYEYTVKGDISDPEVKLLSAPDSGSEEEN